VNEQQPDDATRKKRVWKSAKTRKKMQDQGLKISDDEEQSDGPTLTM